MAAVTSLPPRRHIDSLKSNPPAVEKPLSTKLAHCTLGKQLMETSRVMPKVSIEKPTITSIDLGDYRDRIELFALIHEHGLSIKRLSYFAGGSPFYFLSSEDFVAIIAKCPNLEDFSVRFASSTQREESLHTTMEAVIRSLEKNCEKLKTFSIDGDLWDVETKSVQLALHSLRHLNSFTLKISFNTLLTYHAVKSLARYCKSLQVLNLDSCELMSDQLAEILNMFAPNLKELNVRRCPHISTRFLEKISTHPNLRKLSFSNSSSYKKNTVSLRNLEISNPQIKYVKHWDSLENNTTF